MVIAITTYAQFKNAKDLLGAQVRIVYTHEDDLSGFTAIGVSERNLALSFSAATKPPTWDADLGAISTRVQSLSNS